MSNLDVLPTLTPFGLHLLAEGRHYRSFDKLGAHRVEVGGTTGGRFAVSAPNASGVVVVGDFNDWQAGSAPLSPREDAGIWEEFVPGVGEGARYKYRVSSRLNDYVSERADPYGFAAEVRPRTASLVANLDGHVWRDAEWMRRRRDWKPLSSPMSVYEVHLGSWRRRDDPEWPWLTYRELGAALAEYVGDLGYTHIELLPIGEDFTPVPRLDEPVGVPVGGYWREVLNSDAADYGGSGVGNLGGVASQPHSHHGRPFHVRVAAPPLGVKVLGPAIGERS